MKQQIVRLSYRDMNEYVRQYAENVLKEKNSEPVDAIISTMEAPCTPTFRDEEVAFLLAIMEDIIPDNDQETKMIDNIKNALKNSSEIQNNEKR